MADYLKMMIGRKKEIQELEKLYGSKQAELVAVYGRRRIGKTYLINQVFSDRFLFKHAGLAPEEEGDSRKETTKQLNQFYLNLLAYGLEECEAPKNWLEAFFLLRKLITQKDDGSRLVVFIDELPWMDTRGSDFIQALEGFWNSYGCAKDNLMIIVCGSATSWMENNLINNHGGLYGRVTYEIKLGPFDLFECEEFFKNRGIHLSRYDITMAYMVFGGIPYYLNYIDAQYSLSQNIDNLFFKNNAKLKLEFDRLFRSTFTYSEKAKEIVKLLYANSVGFTKKEIAARTKIAEGGTLTNYLNGLLASDFIVKYVPFGYSKREVYYKLVDPFCLFYLNFCQSNVENENYFSENISNSKMNAWAGFSFERVCFNHVDQMKFALGVSGVSSTCSAYYSQDDGVQIDMVLTRKDNVVNLCEMKFYSDLYKLDKENFLKVNRRANAVKEKISKKASIRNTLVTTYGIDKNEYSSVFTNIITLDDLFRF